MPLGGLRNHPAGVEARWAWLKNEWDGIYKRLPPSLGMLGTVIQLSTSSFCTEAQLKDVQAFFDAKDRKVGSYAFAFFMFYGVEFLANFLIVGLRPCRRAKLRRYPRQGLLAPA
jgi:hypothetical protein